jgi:putative oxidoreductase
MQPYDIAALALRLVVAAEFMASGVASLKDPDGRAKENGVSVPFMIFIGVAETAGSLGLIAGVLARLAAAGLIAIMAGAIYKKIFDWHIGFWGKDKLGWHYELLLVTINFAIAVAGPGQIALLPSAF